MNDVKNAGVMQSARPDQLSVTGITVDRLSVTAALSGESVLDQSGRGQVGTLDLDLDLAAFRRWLDARREVVVGRSACEAGCPVAHFLAERSGLSYEIGMFSYWPERSPSRRRLLPEWASSFICLLDATYVGGQVTGEQALSVLDCVGLQAERV